MRALILSLVTSSVFALWPFTKPPLNFHEASTKSMLNSLSLEEKVGQIFITSLVGTTLCKETREFLRRSKLGNVILFAKTNDLRRYGQTCALTSAIHTAVMEEVRIPPFICIDEEGGHVHHLQATTHFPSARALGICDDEELVRKAYKAMGLEARSLGCNFLLSPVVDLHTEHTSTLLGTRSFGEEPERVAALGRAALEGLCEAGVLGCLKHAPGHGPTAVDTHTRAAFCTLSVDKLEQSHWIPFQKLSDAPALMSSHVTYQAVDRSHPATMSPELLNDVMRATWGFRGLILSDSLTMHALGGSSLGERAIEAFKAGCDCCLIGPIETEKGVVPPSQAIQIIEQAMQQFLRAVRSGEISQARLDASLERILKAKEQLPIAPAPPIDTGKHLKLSQEIAEKSLTLLSSQDLLDSIDTSLYGKRIALLIPETLEASFEKILSALQFLLNVEEVTVHVIAKGEQAEINEILEHSAECDLVFFLSRDIPLFPAQATVAKALASALPPQKLIFAGLSNPWEMADLGLHKTHLVYLTYGQVPSSLIALAKALGNHTLPPGKLYPLYEKADLCENSLNSTTGSNHETNCPCRSRGFDSCGMQQDS